MAFTEFFTPSGYATLVAGATSAGVALPAAGSPTSARVTNAGPNPVAVLIGASGVEVTPSTGLILNAGESVYLATGAEIAAISLGGGPSDSSVFISVGT
jgi:hypothetical protein